MSLRKLAWILFLGLIITACAWNLFSNTPSWYSQSYDESTAFYTRGFGQSRQEDLAIKKAATEAHSAMAVKCRVYLNSFHLQIMKRNGVEENSAQSKDYLRAVMGAEKKIRQISDGVNEETQQSKNLFKAYKLIKVEKSAIEKLYLQELFD